MSEPSSQSPSAANRKKPCKKSSPFKPEHQITYGVKPCEYDPVTNEVAAVQCLFCVAFSRERAGPPAGDGGGDKDDDDSEPEQDSGSASGTKKRKHIRALTKNVRTWRFPFRSDKFSQHLNRQHLSKWEMYKKLSLGEKQEFFEGVAVTMAVGGGLTAGGSAAVPGFPLHPHLIVSPSKAHKILFTKMRGE